MNSLLRLLTFGLLISELFTLQIDGPPVCSTADGLPGECISLLDCTPLYRALQQNPLTSTVKAFLRKSFCGFTNDIPRVCCRDHIYINDTEQNKPTTPTTNELPVYPNCGDDLSYRILGGTITEIDEFPWMAMMGYTTSNGVLSFECGGVLINKRYVLTAAHCVVGTIKTKLGPISIVRLGEYDTDSQIDCVNGFCAPPHENMEVEKVIAHPDFTDTKINRENDIALVRLARDAIFSGFVKPICLPTVPPNMEVGDKVIVSGWGRTLTDKKSNVKLKLTLPIFDKSQCAAKYANFMAILTEKQLCAGGIYAKDSCYGDSGGPLMRRNGPKWESVAVVSFGNGCGGDGWPGVYTDVYKYLPWIRQNLSP